MIVALSPDALQQMIEQHRDDAEAGHQRLRRDLRTLEERTRNTERAYAEQATAIAQLIEWRKAPTEATNIRFSPAMVLSLIALCVSIVGGQKWSTQGMAEQLAAQAADIRVLNVKMDAAKQHNEDVTKLQDDRAAAVTREMTRIGAQATMIDTKLTNLMITRK